MTGLAVPDREFQRLLEDGVVQLDPPLSDDAIERTRHNRTSTFARSEPAYLDDQEAVERYRVYAQAALRANPKRRRLEARRELSMDDVVALAHQREILRDAAVRLFCLLEPMLRYHDAWEELPGGFRTIGGSGLEAIGRYVDRPRELPADDAFVAVRGMRTAADAFGLLYDRRDAPIDPRDYPEYWLDERAVRRSRPPAERRDATGRNRG